METDLLTRISAELEQRMAKLRPLLGEYERLLEASDTLAEAPPAVPEAASEEPEHKRKPGAANEVRQAIIAALEHGSHTIGELVMVTAMSTSEIRTNLSQLARQRKVTRVKRQGDGKSAFALPS